MFRDLWEWTYPCCEVPVEEGMPVHARYVVDKISQSYRLYQNGKCVWDTSDAEELFSYLEWYVTLAALEHFKEMFLEVHAGGVAKGDKAIIFPAFRDSGKTTLTMSLVNEGFRCLSDEVMLVDPDALRVHPFPRNFLVGEKSLCLFPKIEQLYLNRAGLCLSDSERTWYVNPSEIAEEAWAPETNLGGIVNLEYVPSAPTTRSPIGSMEAMNVLLNQTINLGNHQVKGVDALVRMVESVPCWRLKMGSLSEATRAVAELFEQT